MKLMWVFLIIILVSGIVIAQDSNLKIDISVKPEVYVSDLDFFSYNITSNESTFITYVPSISCPTAPVPLIDYIESTVSRSEPIIEDYRNFQVLPSFEPQVCEARVEIFSPINIVEKRTFEIKTKPSFSFNVKTCKDSNCEISNSVFSLGEDVFIDFVSQVSNPEISAILTYPDKTTKQISLPAKINADQIGTYSLEVTATKEDYKTITDNIQFGVIEEEAEIVSRSVCNSNNICEINNGENAQTCPQECSSGSNDDFCDAIQDNICDPDCSTEQDADCRGKETLEEDETRKPSSLAIIIALTFLLIIIIFAYLEFNRLKYHKNLKVNYKEERLNDMREYIQTNLRRGYKKEGIRNALIKIGYNNEEIEEAFRRLR